MILFDEVGKINTNQVLKIVNDAASKNNIKKVIIPSTSGETAKVAFNFLKNIELLIVTHCYGFSSPDTQEFPDDLRNELQKKGVKILTTTHSFGTIGRAIRKKFQTYEIDEIIANTLRIFGQGTKVAIECTLMCADSGLVKTNELVISCGGTDEGIDTALIIKPSNLHTFFDLKVVEILCKPKLV